VLTSALKSYQRIDLLDRRQQAVDGLLRAVCCCIDPITTAILAALPALASDMVKSSVKDAYEGLKAVIRRKWGDTAPISRAISSHEEDPKSKAQAPTKHDFLGVNASGADSLPLSQGAWPQDGDTTIGSRPWPTNPRWD